MQSTMEQDVANIMKVCCNAPSVSYNFALQRVCCFPQDLQTSKTEETMVHENVEHMRQILVDHQRKLDTMANGMDTIQVTAFLGRARPYGVMYVSSWRTPPH